MPTKLDQITIDRILAKLPEYQRRKRRADKLRATQAQLEAMRDKEIELGSQAAPVTRGLTGTSRAAFDPIGSYIPNYSGMAQKAIGAIGGLWADKQADTAEEEMNALRNEEVIRSTQQINPVQKQLAESMKLPATAATIAPSPAVPAPPSAPDRVTPELEEDKPWLTRPDDFIQIGDSAEDPYNAQIDMGGMPPEAKEEVAKTLNSMKAAGVPIEAYSATVETFVKKADMMRNATPPPPGQAPGMAPTMVPEAGAAMQEALQVPPPAPAAPPAPVEAPAGPPGQEVATNDTLRAYLGMLDAKDISGTEANNRLFSMIEDKDGNIYQQYAGGKIVPTGLSARGKGVQYKYDEVRRKWFKFDPTYGPSEVPNIPDDAHATTVDGREMSADEVRAANTSTGGGPGIGAQLTPGEEAQQKADVEIPTEAAKEENKARLEERQTAQNSLGKLRNNLPAVRANIQRVLNNPNLSKALAGGAGSFVPKDEGPITHAIGAGYAAFDKAGADALAELRQLEGAIFAQAFQSLVGQGAGSISNVEGDEIRKSLANISTAQSPERLAMAVTSFNDLITSVEARLAATAAGNNPDRPAAPKAEQPGQVSDEDLLKKWRK